MVHLNLPLELLFKHIINTKYMKFLYAYYTKENKTRKKNSVPVLNFFNATQESRICYFVYNYYAFI